MQQFKRGISPKHSLGLGRKTLIKKWFEEFAPDAEYEIDDYLNVNVESGLSLRNTNVNSLPDNLYIAKYLYLRNTNITSLPDNLWIEGDLYLENTKITSLPDNLKIGGHIFKDF